MDAAAVAGYGDFTALSAPAAEAVAVTPHDSNALSRVPKALFIGTGGHLTMRGAVGSTDTVWKNIPSGTLLWFRAKFVRATGTTAADILALY